MKKLITLLTVVLSVYMVNGQESQTFRKTVPTGNRAGTTQNIERRFQFLGMPNKERTTTPNANQNTIRNIQNDGTRNGAVNLYGVRIFDDVLTSDWSIVNFSSATPGTVNRVVDFTTIDQDNNTTASGEFANGYLYVFNGFSWGGFIWQDFRKISTVDWTVVSVTDVTELCGDMAFDATTNTMFALSFVELEDESIVSKIVTVNLTDGILTDVVTLARYFVVLACSPEGQLYGVDTNGNLCRIDKVTGAVVQKGNTGFTPYYNQSMGFDPFSGRLFWAFSNQTGQGDLVEIDTVTGVGTNLGTIGNNSEIVAFFSNTLADTLFPTVNAGGIAVDTTLSATFNRNITGNILTSITISPDPGNVVATVSNNRLNIAHDSLDYNTQYTVTIPDSAITELSYEIVWSFTTALDPEACNVPTQLVISNIDINSATLAWTENGAGTGWEIKYGAVGFDPETAGTLIANVTTNPYNITGLTDGTNYDVYVRSLCPASEQSDWGGPVNFSTNLDLPPVALTWDFEEGMPGNFTLATLDNGVVYNTNIFPNNEAWAIFTGSPSEGVFPIGTQCAASQSWFSSGDGPANRWMITPPIKLGADAMLQWDARAFEAAYPDGYVVRLSTTNNDTESFTHTILTVPEENGEWTNRVSDLSAYIGDTVYIAFIQNSDDMNILLIDNINILGTAELVDEPLAVRNTTPVENASNVAVNATVSVTFNENITSSDLTGITISPDPGNVSASVQGAVLTIAHADFAHGTEYTVTIPGQAVTGYDQPITWKFTTIAATGIQEIDLSSINIYPNPAEDIITVTGLSGNSTVTLYDLSGRILERYSVTDDQLDIPLHFASGMYMIKIDRDNASVTRKLIIR